MTIYYHQIDLEQKQIKIKKLVMLKNNLLKIADLLQNKDVYELFKKWEGKIYNKRLYTALQKIDKHFYIDTRFGVYLNINFYDFKERSFSDNKGHNIYINQYEHLIVMLGKNSFQEKKIIADDIAEKIKNRADYYLNYARQLEEQIKNIDDYIKAFTDIVNKYNELENSINADIRKEFNLKVCLQLS